MFYSRWKFVKESDCGHHPLQHICLVAKSCLTLWPHRLQHARLPHPSLSPGVCSNPRPLSRWCHPTISSSVAPFSCPQSFWASGNLPVSQLCIRWPKEWSVSINPFNEYSGLISFRIDWFYLLAVQGTLSTSHLFNQNNDFPLLCL